MGCKVVTISEKSKLRFEGLLLIELSLATEYIGVLAEPSFVILAKRVAVFDNWLLLLLKNEASSLKDPLRSTDIANAYFQ